VEKLYKHHFIELCKRLNYNTIVFIKETNEVLGIRDLRFPNRAMPKTASLNIDYEMISIDNSRVFYGLNLALDNQTLICSGSINVIDIGKEHVVIVFFEPRISTFRDNQTPRIMWKDTSSRYLGCSDYVAYENGFEHSMVGYKDDELFDHEMLYSFKASDEAIFSNGNCFWGLIGQIKIRINVNPILVKLEKFPYYSLENTLIGCIIVYQTINQGVARNPEPSAGIQTPINHLIVGRLLEAASIFILIQDVEKEPSIDSFSSNLGILGYDEKDIASGKISLKKIIYPGDYDRFNDEVNIHLYSKKETFWTSVRIMSVNDEIIPARICLTPYLGKNQKIYKIGMLISCEKIAEDLTQNYEKLATIANQMPTVFTTRRADTANEITLITENINQFGYSADEFIHLHLPFRNIIHPDDLRVYDDAVSQILNHIRMRIVCEYRLLSKKNQSFWVRETMMMTTIKGVEYIESAIVNITTSKAAYEALEHIHLYEDSRMNNIQQLSNSFSFTSAVRYANVQGIIDKLAKTIRADVAIFDINDQLVMTTNDKSKLIEQLMSQFIDFASFTVNEQIKCQDENIVVIALPVKNEDYRIGTMIIFGIIPDSQANRVSRANVDFYQRLHIIQKADLPIIKAYGELVAENIGVIIFSTGVALMQIQSSSQFAGDFSRQKVSHELLLEILNVANATDDVEECFNLIMPKIGEVMELSRCSMFQYEESTDLYSLVYEWYTGPEKSRKEVYQKIKKDVSFFKKWDFDKQASFPIDYDDLFPDTKHFREFARAIVGVRLFNEQKRYGFLNFVDNFSPRKWTTEEVMFFEDVANIISSIISRVTSKHQISHNVQEYYRSSESMPAAIAMVETKTMKCRYANQKFWELVPHTSKRSGHQIKDLDACIQRIVSVVRDKNVDREIHFTDSDKWYVINQSAVNFDSEVATTMLILTDITQNKRTQETISSLAFSDILTGIPNRIKFEIDLKELFSHDRLEYNNSFICLLNIDNFRMINNTFSYSFGDSLLKNVTKKLQELPEIAEQLYRFGGDEFCMLIHQKNDTPVYDLAGMIMQIFEKPFYIDGYEAKCTVSMGIVFLNDSQCNVNDLIRQANLALKDAKLSGKNRFMVYDASLKKYEEDTLLMEQKLKIAIDNGCEDFKVFYQPIVTTATEKIVSAEALVRWFSPDLGLISPVKFIPIAESTGLIVPLGKFILNSACKEVKKWLDYGYDISVAVNFSVIQTLQSDLVETITKALNTYRVPPKNLVFEVTESLAINDINKVIEILTAVRQIGVRIAMDDFGTGYSSLNHLRKLPLDIVKIDRSFIFNIEYDPYTIAFVNTIAQFCHMKATRVCCEGVESETQKKMLSEIHVDDMQGYLFGKPCSAEDFWALLIKTN